MSLIEEVKKEQIESYDVWFDRWYEKENLEERIRISAKKGFTGIIINVSEVDNEYKKRRLENVKVIEKLKGKLIGFDIKYEETSGDRYFINRKVGTWYKKTILISWKV